MDINERILHISNPDDEKFLRRATSLFDFKRYTKKETDKLVKTMRAIMYGANGVGLAANQIGLDLSVFVAKVNNKFYAIFNPKISKSSDDLIAKEEGCLSVPGKYAKAYRGDKIIIDAFDRNGKPIRIKTWGLLATVFQHEVDHLNGKLFIDRVK